MRTPPATDTFLSHAHSDIFQTLSVSAAIRSNEPGWPITDSPQWRSLYSAPSLIPFEVQHGIEAERYAYNDRCIRRASRQHKAVCGEYLGMSDLFVPIVRKAHAGDSRGRALSHRATDEHRCTRAVAPADRPSRASRRSRVRSLPFDDALDVGARGIAGRGVHSVFDVLHAAGGGRRTIGGAACRGRLVARRARAGPSGRRDVGRRAIDGARVDPSLLVEHPPGWRSEEARALRSSRSAGGRSHGEPAARRRSGRRPHASRRLSASLRGARTIGGRFAFGPGRRPWRYVSVGRTRVPEAKTQEAPGARQQGRCARREAIRHQPSPGREPAGWPHLARRTLRSGARGGRVGAVAESSHRACLARASSAQSGPG